MLYILSLITVGICLTISFISGECSLIKFETKPIYLVPYFYNTTVDDAYAKYFLTIEVKAK